MLWRDERVAYGDLLARAGRVARRLLALGLPAEARVGAGLTPWLERVAEGA